MIHEFLGVPLHLINKEWYHRNIASAKANFGIILTCMTKWWSPTVIRISGDASVAGQLGQHADGRLETVFPDRIVLIANHQLYSDWIYLWWIGYANVAQMSGHVYIILKESIKYIPLLGPGMVLFNFIFMSRKWSVDRPRMARHFQWLKKPMAGTKEKLRPMWLLLFPEGTNLSDNGRANSAKWAAKQGIPDLQHQMIPRSTGSFFALRELRGTVEWVYDCTLAYEGIPRGKFGQDYLTLRSSYFEGRPPKSVNMYFRRFALSGIPLEGGDEKKFDQWLRDRWTEKDELIEQYMSTGRFPASEDLRQRGVGVDGEGKAEGGFIETEMKPKHWWEVLKVFAGLGWAIMLVAWIVKTLQDGAILNEVAEETTALLSRPEGEVQAIPSADWTR